MATVRCMCKVCSLLYLRLGPALQTKKWKVREVTWLAQGHTASQGPTRLGSVWHTFLILPILANLGCHWEHFLGSTLTVQMPRECFPKLPHWALPELGHMQRPRGKDARQPVFTERPADLGKDGMGGSLGHRFWARCSCFSCAGCSSFHLCVFLKGRHVVCALNAYGPSRFTPW